MSKVLSELFSGNQAADIAFWIIIGLTFLLGMLTLALLAYWPTKRQLNKQLERSKKENELLTKDHKDLSDRFVATNTQYKQVQQDLNENMGKLREQEGTVGRQLREIQYLKEELGLHKTQAKNYKYANDKLLKQYQETAEFNENYQRKLEALKDLVEEIEQERAQLQHDYRKSQREEQQAKQQVQELEQQQEAWRHNNKQLEQDLVAAMQQRRELKQLLKELEDSQQLDNTTDQALKKQVLDVKAHLKSLEAENAELMQRLAPYLVQEQEEQQEAKKLEPLLIDLFLEAEENLKRDVFFVDYAEEDLIEDAQQLKKELQQIENLTKKTGAIEKTEIDLEKEEEQQLEHNLAQAALAMERQGFYENIEEAVLVPLPSQIQQLSHEELLQERLKDTAIILDQSSFYNQEIIDDNLVEKKDFLEKELAKLEGIPTTENTIPTTNNIQLSEKEQQNLTAATEMALTALNQPGLYAPIEASHLLTDKKNEEIVYNSEGVSNQKRLEALVIQEIGNSIPKGSLATRDALQEIDGIGQFMEQQLNQLGIYTYEQISLFDNAFISTLSEALDFPASVIHEKEWVAQAKSKLIKP